MKQKANDRPCVVCGEQWKDHYGDEGHAFRSSTEDRQLGRVKSRADDFESYLAELPKLMESKQAAMPIIRKGFAPGVRAAARAIGISPTTYIRVGRGQTPDVPTLIKIMRWL